MELTEPTPAIQTSPMESECRTSQLSRWDLAEWLLISILLVSVIAGGLWRGWRNISSEFPNNYLVARLHHLGMPVDRVYEWTWLQRQNDHLGVRDGLVSFAPNPPMVELPILPLAGLSPLGAKRVWLIANLGFLALALWMLHQVTSLGWRRVLLIALLCILPLHMTFVYGRYYVLVMMLISASYYAFRRGWQVTAGICIAAATALKLFPVLFLILFLWKRSWRAISGFVAGSLALIGVSTLIFGAEIHRVFLYEVLPQASRGDWLAPYYVQRGTLITLWSHLFLREPELNPAPWIDSTTLYAFAQAASMVVFIGVFLLSCKNNARSALHWATLIPLLLLVTTTGSLDHPCLLIFTAVIGCDALVSIGKQREAVVLVLLFVALSAPVPDSVLDWFPAYRLVVLSGLYFLLLVASGALNHLNFDWRWAAPAVIAIALLTTTNLRTVGGRDEDHSRRLMSSTPGYRVGSVAAANHQIFFSDMQPHGYALGIYRQDQAQIVTKQDEILSLAAREDAYSLYLESTGRTSTISTIPASHADGDPKALLAGQDPALSPNGEWLAYIKEESGRNAAWVVRTDFSDPPKMALPASAAPLELTVNSSGDVIASAGGAGRPSLVLVTRMTGTIERLRGISGPARYPALSPDGLHLTYSRRDYGFWHLVVHDLSNGMEEQLTHGSCNATNSSWRDRRTILYATDCGRGVGLNAIAQVEVPE